MSAPTTRATWCSVAGSAEPREDRWPTPTTYAGSRSPCRTSSRSTATASTSGSGNKGFVWSWPERRPGRPRVIRTDVAVLFVGDEAEKQALLLGEPDVFFTAPGYEEAPLVLLRLAAVDEGRLAELVTDAWRMRAPAELAGQ